MPIPNNSSAADKAVFYTEPFKVLVRSEKEVLLRSAATVPIINRHELHAYRFDIYRLLRSLKIQPHLYWATAYLNGIEDPGQDISGLQSILTVNEEILNKAITRSSTTWG